MKSSGNSDGGIRSKPMVNMAFVMMPESSIIDIVELRFRAVISLGFEMEGAAGERVIVRGFDSGAG